MTQQNYHRLFDDILHTQAWSPLKLFLLSINNTLIDFIIVLALIISYKTANQYILGISELTVKVLVHDCIIVTIHLLI